MLTKLSRTDEVVLQPTEEVPDDADALSPFIGLANGLLAAVVVCALLGAGVLAAYQLARRGSWPRSAACYWPDCPSVSACSTRATAPPSSSWASVRSSQWLTRRCCGGLRPTKPTKPQ